MHKLAIEASCFGTIPPPVEAALRVLESGHDPGVKASLIAKTSKTWNQAERIVAEYIAQHDPNNSAIDAPPLASEAGLFQTPGEKAVPMDTRVATWCDIFSVLGTQDDIEVMRRVVDHFSASQSAAQTTALPLEPVAVEDITPGWYWMVDGKGTTYGSVTHPYGKETVLHWLGETEAYRNCRVQKMGKQIKWYRAPSPEQLMTMCQTGRGCPISC